MCWPARQLASRSATQRWVRPAPISPASLATGASCSCWTISGNPRWSMDLGLVPGCHLLITTREQAVLDRAGAHSHAVGLLDTYASRTLFAQTLGSADLPDEADPVIAACSGLPLALAAAAGMVRRRGWRHTQEAFKRGRLDALKTRWLPDSEQENLAIVLAASVEALPTRQRACFLECAIWPEDVPIPPSALDLDWSAYASDSFDQEVIAEELAHASVLQRDTTGTLHLHDLYHDYLRHRASENLTAMHGALAHRCVRFTETATSWSTLRIGHWRTCPGISRRQIGQHRLKPCCSIFTGWRRSWRPTAFRLSSRIRNSSMIASGNSSAVPCGCPLMYRARNPSELAARLVGRLRDLRGPGTTQLLTDAANSVPADTLLPRGGKHLTAPGSLVATLTGHNSSVRGALLLPEGRRALSWSDDHLAALGPRNRCDANLRGT